METGPNPDPGQLKFEGSWRALGALNARYRDRELVDTIPLESRDIQYQVFHLPPDEEAKTAGLNEYSFISIGGRDYEESDTKMFVLTVENENSGILRVFDTKELDIHIARTGDEAFPDELRQWIQDDMGVQKQLGSATPNQQELERFEEIVKSWERFDANPDDQV
jgi:hypothetical protein